MNSLQTGMAVRDLNGMDVGQVTRVLFPRFEVGERPAGKPPVWLHVGAIYNVDIGTVELICNADGVSQYLAPPPQRGWVG
jgi:hypothetical protein